MNETQLLTADQVARQLGMSRRFVLDERKRGKLRGVQMSPKAVRFLAADVLAYIEARRTGGGREAA